MKKYTHAWLAMMAMKRLRFAEMSPIDKVAADGLLKWLNHHRDSVIKGAWYPDAIICDMGTSHGIKYAPNGTNTMYRTIPDSYCLNRICGPPIPYEYVKGNLPDRCESITQSIIDNFKMQESEEKGSPISPTDNHIATLMFMLSHYIADAHMPLHCDVRPFSEGGEIHAKIEGAWDDLIRHCYQLDLDNERFYYDPEGYPLAQPNQHKSVIDWVENEIVQRKFNTRYGSKNENTWDFVSAITQYSFLTAYQLIPANYDETNLNWAQFQAVTKNTFDDFSKYIMADAIDSISKVWMRIWMRFQAWVANSST